MIKTYEIFEKLNNSYMEIMENHMNEDTTKNEDVIFRNASISAVLQLAAKIIFANSPHQESGLIICDEFSRVMRISVEGLYNDFEKGNKNAN